MCSSSRLSCCTGLICSHLSAMPPHLVITGYLDTTMVQICGRCLICNMPKCFFLQEFAISKNIQLGDEKGLRFPCVWDWSLQFTSRDRLLFHNPLYIGKSSPCVQNGAVKSFKRSKVTLVTSVCEWTVCA